MRIVKTLEPYQLEAVEWLSQRGRGIVQIPAGGGKTLVAARALSRISRFVKGFKIGWIAPTIETRDQAKKALAEEGPELRAADIKAECVHDGVDMSDRHILVVDEAKHATAPSWKRIVLQCRYRFGLDATPFGDDAERNKELLELFGGELFVVKRADVKRLVSARVILLDESDPVKEQIDELLETEYQKRARFIRIKRKYFKDLSSKKIRMVQGRLVSALEKLNHIKEILPNYPVKKNRIDSMLFELGKRFEIYRHCAWQACSEIGIKKNRRRTIAAISAVMAHPFDQVLVLVHQVEHGEEIARMIGDRAVLVHSKIGRKARAAALDAVRNGQKTCLIATSLADEGLDLPNLSVLVLVSGGRSKIKAEQRTGRVLRAFAGKEEGIIYDFADTKTHPVMANQSRKRVALYKSLGYQIEPLL